MMIVTGTGLFALDYLVNESQNSKSELYLGGSCGNVLSILSFLGDEAYPVARLKNNIATNIIIDECEKWGLSKKLLTITEDGSTPIIVQKIYKDKNGEYNHKFEFKCPVCDSWLPRYKPVLAKKSKELLQKHPYSDVFYFDKVSRGALNFANHYKSEGGTIFFEPSSLKDDKQFKEAMELADIIKFSEERIKDYDTVYSEPQASLEIITRGKDGLKYRTHNTCNWETLPSVKIEKIYDTAGAGDFCSAGILHQLGKNNFEGLHSDSNFLIEEALKFGQVLGGVNCLFKGARGAMYYLTKEEFDYNVKKFFNNNQVDFQSAPKDHILKKEVTEGCVIC